MSTDQRPSTHAEQSNLAQALRQAGALYASNSWAAAETLCRSILQTHRDNVAALNVLAIIAAQTQRLNEADSLLARAVAAAPGDASVLNSYGSVLRSLKRLPEALRIFERALAIEPQFAEAHYNLGNTQIDLGLATEALHSFEQSLRYRPNYAEAYNNRGNVLQRLDRHEEAVASYTRALQLKPGYADAYNNRGSALHKLDRLNEALDSFAQALESRPNYSEAHNNRGNALRDLGRCDEALSCYEQALKIDPHYAEASNNRGNALRELRRFEEALASYQRALTIRPNYADAYINRGNALLDLKRFPEALEDFERAVKMEPARAEVHNNLGSAQRCLGRLEEALASFERAVAIRPDYVQALINRGITLEYLHRFKQALASYDEALTFQPSCAEAYDSRGNSFRSLHQYAAALEDYDRALAIDPALAEAHCNRGNVLQDLRRFEEALASYDRSLNLKPDQPWLYGARLNLRMQLCDWSDREGTSQLMIQIEQDKPATFPFPVVVAVDSLALQRRAAEIWIREQWPESRALPAIGLRKREARIRIGYYSADFHNHPVAYLASELFERHDRRKFELTAFSLGPDVRDEMRQRISNAFERFVDVRNMSDKEVALLSRELGIDIAVDLGGFTAGARTGIFAHRAAPVQVNYLGYPGTMGAQYIDYIIADRVIIPSASQSGYSEKVAYLPLGFQATDRRRPITPRTPAREELGLPAIGIVFCCFNAVQKIVPELFSCWMRILRQVNGSILWLYTNNGTAARNMRAQAESQGVSAERLVFASSVSHFADHMARYGVADLFLDTLPYNAHTTASDALWAGVPVLTRIGEAFAARVAASQLTAAGLPELITTSQSEYETLAIELASSNGRLAAMRERLKMVRSSGPLFDTEHFVRHLEEAYSQMYERDRSGLAPDHIEVKGQ